MRNNGVKNIEKYHGLGIDELKKMPTKQLLAIQKSARGCNICSDCGHGHHCSDDVLNDAQREWNDRQWHLLNKVQQILPTREHVYSKSKVRTQRQAIVQVGYQKQKMKPLNQLTQKDFPEAFNDRFAPAITHCRCPKCKSGNLTLVESLEAFTEFEVRDGLLNRQAGIHEFGSYFALNGRCEECGHKWRVKKAIQITDVVVELDPKTFEPI